ncbi:hypothetical protein [Curtobacterium sp. RRHDQ10]|uniref:hypothetical protein n=1 Tax=Curtobacterium phyllosphaerae TaxID=3413379 RepID=UPI003BF5FBEA
MVVELLIAASIWVESRFSRTVLSAGIVFHFGIAVVLGLWSFGVTMAAAILLCRALSRADVFFIKGGRRGGRPLLTTREVQP